MNDSIKRISLDIHSHSSYATVKSKRGDTGRRVCISLVDGGFPYTIGEDCYAVFTAKKPDGAKVYHECTIEENAIVYVIKEQTVAVEGRVNCEVKLYGPDKKLITSPKFTILVSGTVYNEGDEIESEDDITALTALMGDANAAVNKAKAAADAANEAAENAMDIAERLDTSETIKEGTGKNSLIIAEGTASGDNSIAGGTNDSAILEEITGYNIASLPDSLIKEVLGEKYVSLKTESQKQTTAEGDISLAYGVGAQALTPGSMAFGVAANAGCKGFYWFKIDFTNKTITLTETQARYSSLLNRNPVWSDNAALLLDQLSAGDILSVHDGERWYQQIKITKVNAVSGIVTVESLPFSSTSTALLTTPPHYGVYCTNKPYVGVADLGFAALSTGMGTKATGTLAQAYGSLSLAAGTAAHAEGKETEALGAHSHAEGDMTQATAAGSHAEGCLTVASGIHSHAEGYDTVASDQQSHAEGNSTQATGKHAHAEGCQTNASGAMAHAEGYKTEARGLCAHAEGGYESGDFGFEHPTKASGDYSHAEGLGSSASGFASHAEGGPCIFNSFKYYTSATGRCAHAEGGGSKASGDYSHAEGEYTSALGKASHAEGGYAVTTGLKHQNPYSPDRNKDVTRDPISCGVWGDRAHAEGEGTEAFGRGSHAEGLYTYTNANNAHAEGQLTQAVGPGSHAEGWDTVAQGNNSHAEGNTTATIGSYSHAEGQGTVAHASAGHVQGRYNIVDTNGKFAHIVGNGTSTSRSNAHTIDWSGNASFAGSVSGAGADYAEYFEWVDGNPNNEDRVGLIVALDGDKIRPANSGDDILGIVSGTAMVVGDNAEWEWQGKYLCDDYGRVIVEMVEEFDNEGKSIGFFPHRKLNPNYDPEQQYVSRVDRPEWDTVGLVGKLHVTDDGSCVAGGYAAVGANGIATACGEKTNMRVMKRIKDNIVLVFMK